MNAALRIADIYVLTSAPLLFILQITRNYLEGVRSLFIVSGGGLLQLLRPPIVG